MKKIVLLSLCASSISFAATVNIQNLTDKPVLARINNATRRALTEGAEKGRLITWGITAASGVAIAIGALTETGMAIEKAIKGAPKKIAHFKLLKPNKSKLFDSGLYSITKVTFLRITGQNQKTFKASQANEYKELRNNFLRNYGILLKNVSRNKSEIVVSVPTIETYVYELGEKKINPLKVEADIKLILWGNAKRTD